MKAPQDVLFDLLSEIKWGGRCFALNSPLRVSISHREDLWLAENDRLDIIAWGDTRAEAVSAFHEQFVVLWDEFAEEDDAALSRSAISLARVLKSLVDRVSE